MICIQQRGKNYNSEKQLNINFHGCSELAVHAAPLLGPRPSYLAVYLSVCLSLFVCMCVCVYN